jgi:hypothetical protein
LLEMTVLWNSVSVIFMPVESLWVVQYYFLS